MWAGIGKKRGKSGRYNEGRVLDGSSLLRFFRFRPVGTAIRLGVRYYDWDNRGQDG